MSTPESFRRWKPAVLTMLFALAGCPASLPNSPPVIAKQPEPTPLPASVSRIEPQASQAWLEKVQSYFSKVDALLGSETPR